MKNDPLHILSEEKTSQGWEYNVVYRGVPHHLIFIGKVTRREIKAALRVSG